MFHHTRNYSSRPNFPGQQWPEVRKPEVRKMSSVEAWKCLDDLHSIKRQLYKTISSRLPHYSSSGPRTFRPRTPRLPPLHQKIPLRPHTLWHFFIIQHLSKVSFNTSCNGHHWCIGLSVFKWILQMYCHPFNE